MTSRALRSLVLLLLFSTEILALDKTDPFLTLPESLPPEYFQYIERQAIFNASTGDVRYVARFQGIDRQKLKNQPKPYESFEFLHFGKLTSESRNKPPEIVCDCKLLQEDEYVVSEQPVRLKSGRYVSINDETYKAIMELIDYPFTHTELNAAAFSELSYVYNADVLASFLAERNFELVSHHGFMNSADYPGYRDTQYLVVQDIDTLYIVIRGTSGAADIESTLDAELAPMAGLGFAHRGYLDIAEHIYAEVEDLVRTSKLPVMLTGHSMGGSVAIILNLMFTAEGLPVSNLNFAPVPPVDWTIAQYFEGLVSIDNYFLENEELAELAAANNWLRLPGETIRLPDVGTTAGAAHFVINYLKSMLITHGYSRTDYENSLPDCVVIKYPCFDGNTTNFVSDCAFYADNCFERQIDQLLGFPTRQPISELPKPARLAVQTLINRTTRALLETPKSETHRNALILRLAYLNLIAGAPQRSANLMHERFPNSQGGFAGFLNEVIATPLDPSTAAP